MNEQSPDTLDLNFEMQNANTPFSHAMQDPDASVEPPQYEQVLIKQEATHVPDRFNLVKIIFVIFGIGNLLPFSATITAIEFFNKYLLEYEPDFMYSFAINFPQILVQLFAIRYSNFMPLQTRVFYCFLISGLLSFALPFIVHYFRDDFAWFFSMTIMVLFGVCMAIINGSIAGIAGCLPPKFMSAFMLGLSLNGLLPIILRIITLASFGILDQIQYLYGAILFFGVTGAFLAICSLGIFVMIRRQVVIINLAQTLKDNKDADEDAYENENLNRILNANSTASFDEAVLQCVQKQNQMTSFSEVWSTYRQIWVECVAVCLIYLTSLVCYPGLIFQTSLTFIRDESWFQVVMLSVFTLADIIGRFASNLFKQSPSRMALIVSSFLRIGLIATSLLIWNQSEPKIIFDSDWFKLLNTFGIGFTNGMLGTLLMVIGPTMVSREESERAGQIMAFHLTLGRGLGAMLQGIGILTVFKMIQSRIEPIVNQIS